MMIVKVTAADQAKIDELRRRQDYHAFALGQLEWEFLRQRAALLDVAEGGKPDLERLGALQWEHDQKQAFWYGKIKATEDAQRAAGEAALRAAGVDPDAGEYTIENGVVLRLERGAWVQLGRED